MIESGVGTGAGAAAKSAAGAWGLALAALAFLPTLLAALAGVILALILSKDIDVDGKIKITPKLILLSAIALTASINGGDFFIEFFDLHGYSKSAQNFVTFLTAVLVLVVMGVIYRGVELMRGKTIVQIMIEVSQAVRAIMGKGGNNDQL